MSGITTKYEDLVVINTVMGNVGFVDIADYITKNIDSWIGKAVIWDFTGMDFQDTSNREIQLFTETLASTSAKRGGEKSAIVAPQDFQYGMMRAFEVFAEIASLQIHFRVFRKIADAKKWLSEEI